MPDTSPTTSTVETLVDRAAPHEQELVLERRWAITFKQTNAGALFRRMSVEAQSAARATAALVDLLRKRRAGHRITPTDVAAYRARAHRARGWRRRQLALIDAVPLAPVGHLVKPSAHRPGRRAHRRRTR